jgi:hypothetical protein
MNLAIQFGNACKAEKFFGLLYLSLIAKTTLAIQNLAMLLEMFMCSRIVVFMIE